MPQSEPEIAAFLAGVPEDGQLLLRLLGHSLPGFTLETYIHLLPEDIPDVSFVERLNAALPNLALAGKTTFNRQGPQQTDSAVCAISETIPRGRSRFRESLHPRICAAHTCETATSLSSSS